MKRNSFVILFFATLAIIASSCGGSTAESQSTKEKSENMCKIFGAGSTLPEPFYLMTFDAYNANSGDTVRYDNSDTKGGLLKLQEKKIDFVGCDVFLSDEDIARIGQVVHVPTCIVAVGICYNLPGVNKLNLSGDVLADIYSGRITRWNDERIKALNPGICLPEKNIIPIFHSVGSGISYILSCYLSAVSDYWKTKYGATMYIKAPNGQFAFNDADVATKLEETPYTIGYMGAEYASTLNIPTASIRNANGEFVYPTEENITAAADCDIPEDTRFMLVNSPIQGAYPISSFTWIIVYKEQNYNNRTEKQARATVNMLRYILNDTIQQSAKDIDYAPLPKSTIENCLNNLKNITYKGKPIMR